VLAAVVAELVRQGADADRLLRQHIETIEPIRNPYQEVPLVNFVAFFEAGAAAVNDPCLGARIGARFQPDDFGPLGVIFVAASSLQAALNRLGFFLQAWQGGTSAELEIGRDTADWIYRIDDPNIQPRRQDAEFTLSATCCFIRALLGPSWTPLEVHFEHSALADVAPRDRRALETIFRAPIVFEQGVNRLIFDRQDLARQVIEHKQSLAPFLEQHLRDLLVSRSEEWSLSARVTYLIAKRLGRQPLDVSSLAHELGLSMRTLQRRLSDEGTSLRVLIQAHRARVVDSLLESGAAPITQIALSVGYADPTIFSRAFKTWRGASPSTFRHRPRLKDAGR
jgi:AraC-like DNA-binding protein